MPEGLRVVCPSCRTAYRLKPGTPPGARVACRRCGGEMTAPEPHPARPPIGQATVADSSDDRKVSLAPLQCATAGSSSRAEQGKSTVGQADRGTDEVSPPAPAEEAVVCRRGRFSHKLSGVPPLSAGWGEDQQK